MAILNYTHVRDNDYFRDLGNAINTTSQVNLLQEGGVNYNADWGTAMAACAAITRPCRTRPRRLSIPYARLPQMTLNAQPDTMPAQTSLLPVNS